MPLLHLDQNDFSAGSQLAVAPHLIDPRGFYSATNGLLSDDGSVYKRGGSVQWSAAAFGTAGKWIWEGKLGPGRRTVVASSTAFGVTASDASGAAIVNLGGAGFNAMPSPAVAFKDILYIGGGVMYGGSRKAADYSAGTVTVTNSRIVKGGGATFWAANVDAGMLFRTTGGRIYVVANVIGNGELELTEPFEGAVAGAAYTLKRLESATTPYKTGAIYAVSGERLIVVSGRDVWISEPGKPFLFEATIFPQETKVQNHHELEEGVSAIAAQTIGVDKLLVCHSDGVTVFSNLSKAIVDGLGNAQHPRTTYSRDVVAWGSNGIAGYHNTLVVPAVDGVYLMDGVSSPAPLAGSILPRYRECLAEGLTPGGAWVTRAHYFLPLLDSSGRPKELMVCRLDRPQSIRGQTFYPWTFLANAGGEVAYATVRQPASPAELPHILGVARDGNVVDLLSYFNPSDQVKLEHDGSVHLFSLTTRDYGKGDEGITRWRRLELFYESWETEGTVPLIPAEAGRGVRKSGLPEWDVAVWDEFEWASADEAEFDLLKDAAPPNAGLAGEFAQDEWTYFVGGEPARYIRFRLQCADPVAKLVIRGLQIFPAQTGGIRRTRTR